MNWPVCTGLHQGPALSWGPLIHVFEESTKGRLSHLQDSLETFSFVTNFLPLGDGLACSPAPGLYSETFVKSPFVFSVIL